MNMGVMKKVKPQYASQCLLHSFYGISAKTADWDHSIFSLCCSDASGPTPEEEQRKLEKKAGKDGVIAGTPFGFAYSNFRW